ncbi:AzlD domain-containing protein [Marinomonas sp. 2405UD68-3]|uniref:AzlD domain-containing protein n=1 Tax=Marinomonas sp. 2405UD68-3 TaxID=3391835 RepID=UPI0039C8CA90
MNTIHCVFIILGMFAVTFGIRFVLFARANKVVMPAFLDRALKFVPVAVLTAIITPMVVISNKSIDVSLSNSWLLGAVFAFLTGIWLQKQLLTIIVGVFVFFVAKFIGS